MPTTLMVNNLEQFSDQKYLNLETYKKDGTPVKTPVWFVIDNEIVYVVTREKTGKVKRLKHNQNVRIIPCGFRGEEKGEWNSGIAILVSGNEAEKAIKLRKKKYRFSAGLIGLFTSQKGQLMVYAIKLD